VLTEWFRQGFSHARNKKVNLSDESNGYDSWSVGVEASREGLTTIKIHVFIIGVQIYLVHLAMFPTFNRELMRDMDLVRAHTIRFSPTFLRRRNFV